MKVYTSEISQYGKELLVANEIVKFDKIGCAEVSEEVADKLIAYSGWYTKEKMKPIEPIKVKSVEQKVDDSWKEQYQLEIEKLKKQDEARVSKIKSLIQESEDIRKDMQTVVDERNDFKHKFESNSEIWEKEKEKFEYKYQLALLEVDELKDMCNKLGLKEESYKNKRKKEGIIDLIINASES